MQKILLVEDSPEFRAIVNAVLKHKYELVCVDTISGARSELAKQPFDLILLDVTLPDGDGFEFCAELQRQTDQALTPVVLLTGKVNPSDKVMGWNTGADDYIEKPFNPFEFEARIQARIRKNTARQAHDEIIVKGSLKLDIAFHEAKILSPDSERAISLTRNEFRLLHHFVRNQDRVLSRGQLQQAVWGGDTHVTERTVDKHISALRHKLDTEAHCIQTVSGLGYRFSTRKAA
jgi:DNA-binding response OmpR family regulator